MEAVPELLQLACERAEQNLTTEREMKPNLLSIHLAVLHRRRGLSGDGVGPSSASSHTVASYRDTFRLRCFRYAAGRLGTWHRRICKSPTDAELVGQFLSFAKPHAQNFSARSRIKRSKRSTVAIPALRDACTLAERVGGAMALCEPEEVEARDVGRRTCRWRRTVNLVRTSLRRTLLRRAALGVSESLCRLW